MKFLSSTFVRIAILLGFFIIPALLLVGFSGGMRAISTDQSETINIPYHDGFGTEDV